jgi:glycosyltransferase involved in cell wall biosynthesis
MGKTYPVTVVVPLRNETQSLAMLIDSLRQQTVAPAEIVLVDGGSTDGTETRARELTHDDPRFRILQIGPATPGRGRNEGIAAARHDLIALTDAGIQVDPSWLEELLAIAEQHPGADVVYGNYDPILDSYYKKCASLAYVPMKERRPDGSITRGPSIASMLLKRQAWQQVGGIPDLRAAEDLIFMKQIEDHGFQIEWAPRAHVRWQLQPTLASTFRKFVVYSRHNVWAGRQWDWHYGIARKYLVGLVFLILALVHSWWWLAVPIAGAMARAAKSIYVRREGRGLGWLINPLQFFGVLIVMLTIDLAAFVGWAQSFWQPRESVTAQV